MSISFESIRISDSTFDSAEKLLKMQNFITDSLNFVKEMASIAGGKINIYLFNIFENGYGIDRAAMSYLPAPIPDSEKEWKPPQSTKFKDIAFIYDPNDPISIKNFELSIPIFLANLVLKPAAFVVRVPKENMDGDVLWFAFTPWGSLLPSQVVGHHTPSKSSYFGPPRTGMRWSGGTLEEYKNWYLYRRWNEIVSQGIYGIHNFNRPIDFYRICNLISFIRDFRF